MSNPFIPIVINLFSYTVDNKVSLNWSMFTVFECHINPCDSVH